MLDRASESGQLLGCFRSIEGIVRFIAVFVQFLKNLALFISEQGFVRSHSPLVPLKKKSKSGRCWCFFALLWSWNAGFVPLPLMANSCVYPSEDLHDLGLCVKGEAMSGKQISAVGGQCESQHLQDDSPSAFLAGQINSRARPLPAVSCDLGKHFLDCLQVASSTWQPIILYLKGEEIHSL